MVQDEVITHEKDNDEAWICICGNQPSEEGFFPCDEKGNETDPDANWGGLYVCARCGRMIDLESLHVVGRNPEPKFLD